MYDSQRINKRQLVFLFLCQHHHIQCRHLYVHVTVKMSTHTKLPKHIQHKPLKLCTFCDEVTSRNSPLEGVSYSPGLSRDCLRGIHFCVWIMAVRVNILTSVSQPQPDACEPRPRRWPNKLASNDVQRVSCEFQQTNYI